jgi:tRNA A-37 threonylcarbamoyl transferase component Bud32
VRKISSHLNYNERLEKQMLKQKNFISKNIFTPKVLSSGINDTNLFYFDMEYVGGTSFNRFISTQNINVSLNILESLIGMVRSNKSQEKDINITIQNKINSLSIDKSYEKYKKYCREFNYNKVLVGKCHGDLTFENIIIYNSKIYLIDFLDSFVDSMFIDYGKLLQDIVGMWSWRLSTNPPFVKNVVLYEKIVSTLTEKELQISNRMLILNLLRIIPYADQQNYTFVRNSLKYIGQKLNIR